MKIYEIVFIRTISTLYGKESLDISRRLYINRKI